MYHGLWTALVSLHDRESADFQTGNKCTTGNDTMYVAQPSRSSNGGFLAPELLTYYALISM